MALFVGDKVKNRKNETGRVVRVRESFVLVRWAARGSEKWCQSDTLQRLDSPLKNLNPPAKPQAEKEVIHDYHAVEHIAKVLGKDSRWFHSHAILDRSVKNRLGRQILEGDPLCRLDKRRPRTDNPEWVKSNADVTCPKCLQRIRLYELRKSWVIEEELNIAQ